MPKQKLFEVEWGLWNNSWVKNLPVRPLAPRRKTPVQLYPHSMTPRAWSENKLNLCSFGLNMYSLYHYILSSNYKKQTKHF